MSGRRGLLALLVAAAALVGLELGAGALPEPAGTPLPADPELLWGMRPGRRVEGGAPVDINADGLRGPPLAPPAAGARRLVALGDSSVFGWGVALDQSFALVAAGALGPPWEARLAAVPGYSSVQALGLLRRHLDRLDPDALVVATLWSDLGAAGFEDAAAVANFANHGSAWAWRASALLQRSALYRQLLRRLGGQRAPDPAVVQRVIAWNQARRPPDPGGAPRVPLALYEDNLRAFAALAALRGAAVVYLGLADARDLEGRPDPGAVERRAALARAAAFAGAPYVDGPGVLAGMSPDAAFLDGLHPSAAAHARLGAAVAAALAPAGPGDRSGGAP